MNKKNYALITGGTSGIGFEIAKRFALEGRDLFLGYLKDEEKARSAVEELRRIGKGVTVHSGKFDLSRLEAIPLFLEEVKRHFPDSRLTYFISSHGRILPGLFLQKRTESILEVVREHLLANLVLTHSLLKEMCVSRYGRVIFITSLAAHQIRPGQADYALSKAALETFVKSLTAEYSQRNVTFNCICPGLVNTEATASIVAGLAESGAKVNLVPAGEIAELAMFLSSDRASAVSGSTFMIDGGQLHRNNKLEYHNLSFYSKSDEKQGFE